MSSSNSSQSKSNAGDAATASSVDTATKSNGEKPAKPAGQLMTFKAPKPSRTLIKALAPVNRWLNLGGVPVLRALPVIGKVPGIRGIVNIPVIDFPRADERRLARAAARQNACFIVPNHPEFFTDWMLDKEIMSRAAPNAASWATHGVVNGMGAGMQKFWLKNNLIAQIPGAGGAKGKAYSVDWALMGNGVLLHPEGGVGWHGDLIAPLFSGALDMAAEAVKRAGAGRRVLVAPVVWKLKYNRDVEAALHKELSYVERVLALPRTAKEIGLARRLYNAYAELLARDETCYGVHPTNAPFFDRQTKLRDKLLAILDKTLNEQGAAPAHSDDINDLIRRGEHWVRGVDKTSTKRQSVRRLMRDLRQLLRFHEGIYPQAHLTQEHIGESIKRLRYDYCTRTMRDKINAFIPQPAGPRTAHIRVPEPLDISALIGSTAVPILLDDLRQRMQMALDEINRELAAKGNVIKYENVFLEKR